MREITLKKGEVIYIYVGGAGANGALKVNSAGDYNGGGLGTWGIVIIVLNLRIKILKQFPLHVIMLQQRLIVLKKSMICKNNIFELLNFCYTIELYALI